MRRASPASRLVRSRLPGSGAITATALAGTARLPDARRPAALAAFGACLAGFSATAPLAGAAATHWSWRAALVLPVLSIAVIPPVLAAHRPPATTGTGGLAWCGTPRGRRRRTAADRADRCPADRCAHHRERRRHHDSRRRRPKYRRLRSFKRFKAWWSGILEREPGLFMHWARAREFVWTR
ncbi:hypothetical protein [Micromonospora sp. B11E3]|uniref:hypothetical protein n=1 Tax=Micromonospora sp. B11E3 TaxID=3153562 RepID=UPI00325FCF3C